MSSESNQINIDDIDKYDSVINFLYVLKRLEVKTAGLLGKEVEYDLRSEFYCGECDEPRDDCSGHIDYDYYIDQDFDYEDSPRAEDKPSGDGKV